MSEIVVILVIALIFLGPRKLPEIASGIGKAIREVRKASAGIKQEIELDETIRKPLEDLREAIHLSPEELKRRDDEKKWREQWEKEDAERRAKEAEQGTAGDGSHDPHAGLDPHDPQFHHPDGDGASGSDGTGAGTGMDGTEAAGAGASVQTSEPAADAGMQEMALGDSSLHEIAPGASAPPPVPASASASGRLASGPGAKGAADRTVAMSAPPSMEGITAAPALPSPKGSSLPPPSPGIAAGRAPSTPSIAALPTLPAVGGTVPRPPVPGATLYGMPAPSIPGVRARPPIAPAPGAPASVTGSASGKLPPSSKVAAADATKVDLNAAAKAVADGAASTDAAGPEKKA
jgi:TatA/E family protein of Tat protein translocase